MIKEEKSKDKDMSCCENKSESISIKGNNLCPICSRTGIIVKNFTVKHMVQDDKIEQVGEADYFICMNETCDAVYFHPEKEKVFVKDEIKVPIWFKKDANPKYACYCSKVTEEQVIDAVVIHGAKTVREVNSITGAMKNSNCKANNPLGICCHSIIQAVIDKVS